MKTRENIQTAVKEILIIEDDPIDLFLSEKVIKLSDLPFTIETENNGLAGLQRISKNIRDGKGLPDVILIDLYMPVVDGQDFLKAFGRMTVPGKNDVVIVMLTISHDYGLNQKLLALGAHCVLHKPLEVQALKKCLQEVQYAASEQPV